MKVACVMKRWSAFRCIDSPEQMYNAVSMVLNEVKNQVQADEAVDYEIKLVLSELVQNAVLHGKPPVKVSATLCQGCVIFMVEDSGEGFNVPQVCDAFDIFGESGRGIRIISSLAQVLSFNESANRAFVRLKIC
ncbi:hypothetical protein SDC9_149541 [bioreactor metagenome]|uniref:Histidine kinase/HSP90-like ATPase domain-containing protein n=1 Tax=bioreactor metagenome TaxID=1076179 RepID=A0A645EJW7_9ZZZZ